MKRKLCVVAVAAALALSGCSKEPVGDLKLDTSSQESLAATLEAVKSDYGDSAARQVFNDIALVVGNHLSDPSLDDAYMGGDSSKVVEKLDSLRYRALEEVNGMTVRELREKAEPMEHEYRLDRKEKAQARLPTFEEERSRVKKVKQLHKDIELLSPEITRVEDEFGYMEPSFSVNVKNSSDLSLRALDLEVHSWSTVDTSVKGTAQVRLLFGDESINPGESRIVTQAISPFSGLASAVADGAGQGIRLKLLVTYSEEQGRMEMTGEWTETMEANYQKLKSYAAYGEG